MKKIREINKNYFHIHRPSFCSVLVEKELFKEAIKIEKKYAMEMSKLLNDNKDKCIPYEWSLCYPNGEQTKFYYEYNNNLQSSIDNVVNIEVKEERVFDLGGLKPRKDKDKEEIEKQMKHFFE